MTGTQRQIVGVLTAGLLTPLTILVAYTDWSLFWEHPTLATELFSKWPWFTGTCALTTITFLYPYFAHWRSQGDYHRFEQGLAGYLGVLFVAVLFLYPGTSGLGIHNDDRWWSILLIVASQYAGLTILAKGVFPPPSTPVPAWALASRYMEQFNEELGPGCEPVGEHTKKEYVNLIAPLLKFAVPSTRRLK